MHSRLASRMLKTNFKSSFIPIQACEHIIHEFTAFVKSVQQEIPSLFSVFISKSCLLATLKDSLSYLETHPGMITL